MKLSSLLRRFDANERGTALTEFVIVLPIFIVIFVAIISLTKFEQALARTKMVAATETWSDAMVIHDNALMDMPPFERSLPVLAASDSMGVIGGRPSPQGDMTANLKNIAMMTGGSRGEARVGLLAGGGGTPYDYGDDFAEDMTKDTFIDVLPSPGDGLGMFALSIPYSVMGTRHAVAAGTRYGLAYGEASRSASSAYGSATYNAGYDVLVSPTSQNGNFISELIIVGFSRLAAEDSDCLNSVLEISNAGDYGC